MHKETANPSSTQVGIFHWIHLVIFPKKIIIHNIFMKTPIVGEQAIHVMLIDYYDM